MRVGIIPIVHNNCWASDTCEMHPDIQFDVALYQVLPTSYKVLVQVKTNNSNFNDFIAVSKSIIESIRKHKSIEGFKILKESKPDEININAIYDLEINDEGYSTGATRIMSRVKGAHLYPYVSMPVRHDNGMSIEYLSAIFDDDAAFKNTVQALNNDSNITVLNDNSECRSYEIKDDEKWTEQKTVFTEFFMLTPEIENLFIKLLSKPNAIDELTDETKFLDVVFSSPYSSKIIKSIIKINSLSDFYELLSRLLK